LLRWTQFSCLAQLTFADPLRIMCMISRPARVIAADQKALNPNIGLASRVMARWSCSTMLLSGMIFDDATGLLGETARRLYPG
jgi:hypothetical protein